MHRFPRRFKGRTPLRIKLLLALSSLLLSLMLLEIALRFLGPMSMRSEKIYRAENLAPGPKILAVGDSFTHGGLTGRNETYPYYLERLINGPEGESATDGMPDRPRTRVVNAGVCAMNTRELWDHLPGWVDTFQPEALLLLLGSANWFSSLDYDLYRRGDWKSRIKRFLYASRVVKLLHYLRMHFLGEDLLQQADPPTRLCFLSEEAILPGKSDSERYGEWLDAKRTATSGVEQGSQWAAAWNALEAGDTQKAMVLAEAAGPGTEAVLVRAHAGFLARRFHDTDDALSRALAEEPESELVRQARAYYRQEAAHAMRNRGSRYEALEWYLKAIEAAPEDPDNYCWTYVMSLMQSQYSALDLVEILDGVEEANPELAGNEAMKQCRLLLAQRVNEQADLLENTRNDLQRVVDLCAEKGVRLFILNYPISYPMINGILRDLADQHRLPFVDILAAMGPLTPRDRYLLDDEHCTPEGHQVMAQEVYRSLREHGVLGAVP